MKRRESNEKNSLLTRNWFNHFFDSFGLPLQKKNQQIIQKVIKSDFIYSFLVSKQNWATVWYVIFFNGLKYANKNPSL